MLTFVQQRQANQSVTSPLCPQQQTADSWLLFNLRAMLLGGKAKAEWPLRARTLKWQAVIRRWSSNAVLVWNQLYCDNILCSQCFLLHWFLEPRCLFFFSGVGRLSCFNYQAWEFSEKAGIPAFLVKIYAFSFLFRMFWAFLTWFLAFLWKVILMPELEAALFQLLAVLFYMLNRVVTSRN